MARGYGLLITWLMMGQDNQAKKALSRHRVPAWGFFLFLELKDLAGYDSRSDRPVFSLASRTGLRNFDSPREIAPERWPSSPPPVSSVETRHHGWFLVGRMHA